GTSAAAESAPRRVRPARRGQRPAGGRRLRAGEFPAVSLCAGAGEAAASLAAAAAADRCPTGRWSRCLGDPAGSQRLAADRTARSLSLLESPVLQTLRTA